jgi:hypothetical protein
MIRTNQLVDVVKELVYTTYTDTNEITKLKAVNKFYRIILDTAADLLEAKAKGDCNIYLLQDLILYQSIYAKAYNFLLDSMRLVEVSGEEKELVLQKISSIEEIDDTIEIMDIIDSLTALQSLDSGEHKESAVEQKTETQVGKNDAAVRPSKRGKGITGKK